MNGGSNSPCITPSRPTNYKAILPSDARTNVFRPGDYYGPTVGFCLGYVQANIVVLPSVYADDFEVFCRKNPGPLPLLYRSKPGEVSAPPLAADSDVRSDLPRYVIFSHGRQVQDMRDLLGFDWSDKTSFYIGCSYTFEDTLIQNGIDLSHVGESKNVAMYISSIECCDDGAKKFAGTKLVVSMRPIKRHLLEKATIITSRYPMEGHGAPVHIGDPKKIGIASIEKADYGDEVIFGKDEVPVFWACGVTGKLALQILKADVAFSHYPGSMFITDKLSKPLELTVDTSPCVVPLSPARFPFHASLVSEKTLQLLQQLEEVILHDPGNCHVAELKEGGDFLKSVLILSHCKSVGVVFGFPCNMGYECMEETDGPPGAFAIAKALQCLGKRATIISEERNRVIVESTVELMVVDGSLSSKVDFKSCKEVLESNAEGFDCLISIERVGQAKDGGHYSMRGVDLTSHVDLIDEVFTRAQEGQSLVTIGIGDRGNELGLGRLQEKAKKYLPTDIVCDVASDYVVLAGVSNWGGYAIAAGLYLLVTCPVHWRYLQHGIDCDEIKDWDINGFIQTDKSVESMMKHLNGHGVRDGISKSLDQSVDGIPLKTHLEIIKKLRAIATS